MGTWCTLGVERTRRDNERVEIIKSQGESMDYAHRKIKRLETKIRKLQKETKND